MSAGPPKVSITTAPRVARPFSKAASVKIRRGLSGECQETFRGLDRARSSLILSQRPFMSPEVDELSDRAIGEIARPKTKLEAKFS